MESGWQLIALLMALSFLLGLCIGKLVSDMMDKVKSGDRNVRGECHNSLCLNLNDFGRATQNECLGTEVECTGRQLKVWDADGTTKTVLLATQGGSCLHLIDCCSGLARSDRTRPMKEYTLCKFYFKEEPKHKNMSQKKGK